MTKTYRSVCANHLCGYCRVSVAGESKDGWCPLCGEALVKTRQDSVLITALEKGRRRVTPEQVNELLSEQKGFDEKFKGPLQSIWVYVQALWELLKDPRGAWPAKATAAAVLLYVASPFDVIPDFIPAFGFMDDAGIVMLAVGLLAGTLPSYIERVRRKSPMPMFKSPIVYVLPAQEIGRNDELDEKDEFKIRYLTRERLIELGLSSCTGVLALGVAYAMHPYVRNQLVPLHDYHRALVEQKWREYNRVLPILGCAQLTVERVEWSDKSSNGGIEAPIAGLFGGKFSVDGGKVRIDQTTATDWFPDRGALSEEKIRRVYEDAVWSLADSQLSDVVEKRIDAGLSDCQREFTTSVDSHINARLSGDVALALKKVGLKVGGEYSDVFVTKVVLRVKFHPFGASAAEWDRLREARVREMDRRLEALK